jgi:hypothetical protein
MPVATRSGAFLVGVLAIATHLAVSDAAPSASSLDQAFTIMQQADFVDLTHAFGPSTPLRLPKMASTSKSSAIQANGALTWIPRRTSTMA